MVLVVLDLETASACNLKTAGAWRYSLHETTRVWCAVFKVGDSPPQTWRRGDPPPVFPEGATFLAHNCGFEKALWENVLTPRCGWPELPESWEDTQAHAAAANLPVTLEGLGAALGAPVQKDQEGHDLMLKMCVLHQDALDQWVNDYDTPENQQRLLEYCVVDVESTYAIWQRVPKMIPEEHRLWLLDQKINRRGVYLDRPLVQRMLGMAEQRRLRLQVESFGDSGGDLLQSASTPALKRWLDDNGVKLPKVQRTRANGEKHMSATVGKNAASEMLAKGEAPPAVLAVLENRLEASKLTSLAKLRKVELMVDPRDGRLRGALQFCAAHTGRWSSRGLQVHNFPRPKKGDTPEEKAALKRAYQAVLDGDSGALEEVCREAP